MKLNEIELANRNALLDILNFVPHKEIANAMREFAEYVGCPDFAFQCNGECRCGANCGEDDDCFACFEIENLEVIEFRQVVER